MAFQITSSAFQPGAPIPAKYTCDGADVSPPLEWTDPPDAARSFALVCDDPDAPVGTWIHWVIYNIPAASRGLPEAVPGEPELPDGSRQGRNSWGRTSYGGPCPPGGTHRYFFRLYALDAVLDLPPGAAKADLLRAMDGHVLASAELMGTYRRG